MFSKKNVLFFITIFSFIILIIEPAIAQEQAIISYDQSSKTISIESGTATLQDIADNINAVGVIEQTDNIYTVSATIYVATNAGLVLNNDILKMNCSFDGEYAIINNGDLDIVSSHITTINPNFNSYIDSFNARYIPRGWSFTLLDSSISNMGSNSRGIPAIMLGHMASAVGNIPKSPVIIKNSTMEYCEYGLLEFNAFGILPDDYYIVENNNFLQISSSKVGNAGLITLPGGSQFKNNSISYVSTKSYLIWTIGQADVLIQNNELYYSNALCLIGSKHSNNVTIQDNYMYGNSGSAIIIYKGWVDNYEFGDIVINNTIKKHYGDYAFRVQYYSSGRNIIKDNTIQNVTGNAFFFLATNNTLFEGNTIQSCTGTGIDFWSTSYRDVMMTNSNLTFKDNVIQDCFYSLNFIHPVENSFSINDSYLGSVKGIRQITNFTGGFINRHPGDGVILSANSVYNDYKYLDTKVVDINGNPLENVKVTVRNDVDTNYPAVNLVGEKKISVLTSATGHIPSVSNLENSLAIMDFKKSSSETKHMSYTIEVEKDIVINLSSIKPDSTWYRENSSVSSYTITAVIPEGSTSNPSIIGFAPSENNPFTKGETKKFQVWSDEDLTTMKWYVDSDLRSSGSMSYDWTVETGSHTIMFTGSNSNGAVVKIWEITEGESSVESPVSSGSTLTFVPSATSLTATTGESASFSVESSDEFALTTWYLDDLEVATGTTTYIQDWDTAGTHTLTFEGLTTTETITRTWNAVVSESEPSAFSSISISPSSTTVAPGESFTIDVYVDPAEALTGSQFDLQYSQFASVSTVSEGNLFTQGGLSTTFEYGSIDNTLGVLTDVYSAIVDSGTVSVPGTMATITMNAGTDSGILDLSLGNVVLSDASSNPAGYTVTSTSVLIDTAPVFPTISAQSVEEGLTLGFDISATDAEGDALTYTSTSIPSGASLSAQTFSWTPADGDAGSYTAVFEVTDGYLTDTLTVPITVTPMNHAPVITLFEPADESVFEEGSIIDVNVAANDEDGDSLSYVIKIDGIQVSTASSYVWTVDYESAGTHTIEVIVSDGTDTVSSSGTVTITDLQPRWDVNEDGVVNVLDITLIGQNYGSNYSEDLPRWDVNQDGTINIQDLSIVSGHFGETVE
ncbi:right-handed parallel beta-helix repeat-containing protein [Methanolobus sp. WCC4]|uniref:right-handed parallel beta-helix repeat-containing protein n=1 Tax=Methanolobus sp. WCC4 TaxID=3125784 RepID=UPI0030F53120